MSDGQPNAPKPGEGPGRAGIVRVAPHPPAPPEPRGTACGAPIDDGADPRHINLAKLNLASASEAKLRAELDKLDLEKRRVTWDETRQYAEELGLDPHRLRTKMGQLNGGEVLALRNVVSQNMACTVEFSRQLQSATTQSVPTRVGVNRSPASPFA